MFNLRFDLRTPPFTEVTHGDQYRAMLEMVKWADTRGFAGAITSEHHGTEDGFMSAPLAISGALLFTFLGWTTINIYSQVGFITLVGLIAKKDDHAALIIPKYAPSKTIPRNQSINTCSGKVHSL